MMLTNKKQRPFLTKAAITFTSLYFTIISISNFNYSCSAFIVLNPTVPATRIIKHKPSFNANNIHFPSYNNDNNDSSKRVKVQLSSNNRLTLVHMDMSNNNDDNENIIFDSSKGIIDENITNTAQNKIHNSSENLTDGEQKIQNQNTLSHQESLFNSIRNWFQSFTSTSKTSSIPIQIQDVTVLYYDIILIINLSVSTSFWVVHRLSLWNVLEAFNEGCLLSIFWIISGLYNGAFLYMNIDGNKIGDDNDGGPKAAGLLGLWTFVGTINLRILIALCIAISEHRPVGIADGEELIPLELSFGLVLMSMWRMLHSAYSRV